MSVRDGVAEATADTAAPEPDDDVSGLVDAGVELAVVETGEAGGDVGSKVPKV